MRTTVELPAPLLDNAKKRAAELNVGGGLVDPTRGLDKFSEFLASEDDEEYLNTFAR